MSTRIRVLIVDDSEDDALLLVDELRRGGFEPEHLRVDTPAAMAAALKQGAWDLITVDHTMPQFSSAAALKLLNEDGVDTPLIIVSGTISEEAAVAAMQAGARDYLLKGQLKRLIPAVTRELREAASRRERRKAQRTLLAQEEQLRIAREVQQRLFPVAAPDLPGFAVAGASFPAEATGGDYFDFIPMPEDHWGLVIGDITGHGLGPSLLMAEMRACLRTLASGCLDVQEIFSRANRVTKQDFGEERFVTLLFARLSPRTRSLVYLNAGHPAGYVVNRAGTIRATLPSAGMPLGMHPLTEEFPTPSSVTLEPGESVVFVTDGLLDAFGDEDTEQAHARLVSLLREHHNRSAAEMVDALCQAARMCSTGGSQADDITAVVCKVEADSQQ